jgi:hypothetical protein
MDKRPSEKRSRKESVRFAVFKAKNLFSSVSNVPVKAYRKSGEFFKSTKSKFFKKDE